MKRLSAIVLAVCVALPLAAQVKNLNLEGQRKKINKSSEEIANPKKSDNPKTWLSRGDLLQEIFAENTSGLWMGMSKPEVRLIIGEAQNAAQEQIGGTAYDVLSYPNKDLFFENDKLAFWRQTNIADPDLLFSAQEAYQKAIELDAQGKLTKKIKEGLTALADKMRQEGLCSYSMQNYQAAQRYFIAAAACKLNPAVNIVDSVMIYYAGVVSAVNVKDYEKAIYHFKLCIQHQYYDGGNVYTQIAAAYQALGDTTAQEEALKEGFRKFPVNQEILIGLINFYISKNDDPAKVIDLLKQAQEGDPTNVSLYFVEGTLYDKLGKREDAMRLYKKSTEIDPKYYDGYYNMGILYYNKAVEYLQEASAIKDWKSPVIKELEGKANNDYKLALAEFLKAYEIDPTQKMALEAIKNIYFRFRSDSPEMSNLYEEFKAKWEAAQ